MNENIVRTQIATLFVDLFYDKLRYMAANGMEGTPEYNIFINKVKHCVDVENDEYNSLSDEELLRWLVEFDSNSDELTSSLIRQRSKLQHQFSLRSGSNAKNYILLSDVISTKLLIDVAKLIDYKITNLEVDDNASEEDIAILNIHNKAHQFSYFTANDFMEELAIKYHFDIHELPRLSFEEIEEEFGMTFLPYVGQIFLQCATGSVDELFSLTMDDKYSYVYAMIFQLSRIETIINYLDLNGLNELSKHFNMRLYENNNQMFSMINQNIKKLIRKRKEELN